MLWPAIVSVPDRPLVLMFGENVAVTGLPAVPNVGETLIQLGSVTEANQAPPLHPLGLAPTVKIAEPPLDGTIGTEGGLAENVQLGGATVTLTVCAAHIVSPTQLNVRVPEDPTVAFTEKP
jgi:hypothetical protein